MSEFIIDLIKIRNNLHKIRNIINADKFFYSLKANSELFILKELYLQGCFFEIASANEYEKVIKTGADSENIICGIPVKPLAMLHRLATEKIAYFVFDDMHEFAKLEKYAQNNKKVMRIYISDIDSESAPWGIKYEDLENQSFGHDFYDSISGYTFHIARNYQINKMQKAFDRVEQFLRKHDYGKKMIVNIGGGLYGELPPHMALKYDLSRYYDQLNAKIEDLKRLFDVDIYCEPGRAIVETACHILTEVELVTERDGKTAVFIDLNIGFPVGSSPYRITVMHDGYEEEIYNNMYQRGDCTFVYTSFFDTVCEYVNFFTFPLKRKPILGEQLKLYGMGAYTVVRSSVFHSRKLLATSIEGL